MTFDNELRVRAERAYDQRVVERLSAGITDPGLKDLARQFASGHAPAAQILRRVEQSPGAMRRLEERFRRYAEMPHDEVAALEAQRVREISQVEAELAEADHAASHARRPARRRADEQDDPSWEDRPWMR